MSSEHDPYIKVLLIESEKETVSILTLSLSGIKECRLDVVSGIPEALRKLKEREPDLILYGHSAGEKDGPQFLAGVHEQHPSLYLIVSIPEGQLELMGRYLQSGANDCIVKDRKYVGALVAAVKKALIRIAERESFVLPPLSRADQFAMDENLPDLVFLIDREGRILHVNRAVTAFLGYKQSQVIQRPFAEVLGREGKTTFLDYLRGIDFSQNLRGRVPLVNSSGEEQFFEINCTCLEDVIYGVLKRDSSWEAVADMMDAVALEEENTQHMQALEDDMDEESMPSMLGPYRVVTLLGAGAMGRVYKGYDEQLDRHVAIKVISRTLATDQEYLTRFHREARILASITHPNIALIYHYDNTGGSPFFCMEFMSGGSLEDVLQQTRQLDPETAFSYAMQVALGLSEAAKKGVVHLDIKPSNLMIAEHDRIKIVDFGLAKNARELERGGMGVVGTPHYIAPEQVQGTPVDFRADIYSLGVTLYRMLYGQMPFSGSTLVEILHNQFHREVPAREELDPGVPASAYEIATRMMARDPARRYASYSDLIQDLENARRALHEPEPAIEIKPVETAILKRGMLYDEPFAEVLGEIIHRNLSGKLTLSWIDLKKNIQFKNGQILAVLSNQEGESFIELLLKGHHLSTKQVRQIESNSIDLFLHYSTAMSEIHPEIRQNIAADIHQLAWKILQGMFSWMVGEFIFEADGFEGQVALQIPAGDVLARGVKEWIDPSLARRRLLHGRCRIVRSGTFQERLSRIHVQAADSFLLFRFEKEINFQDLFNLSGISEEEFYRLIYLFLCAGIVTIEPLPHDAAQAQPSRKAARPRMQEKMQPEPAPAAKKPLPPAAPRVTPQAAPVAPQQAPPGALFHEAPVKPAAPKEAPADMAKYYYNFALQSFRNKNYWAAVEYCKKSLDAKKEAGTYLLMGNAFATHPNFRFEAMNAFKNALELDPVNYKIHRDMGELYFKTGNMALARAKFQEVVKLEPEEKQALRRLEEIAEKTKKK